MPYLIHNTHDDKEVFLRIIIVTTLVRLVINMTSLFNLKFETGKGFSVSCPRLFNWMLFVKICVVHMFAAVSTQGNVLLCSAQGIP